MFLSALDMLVPTHQTSGLWRHPEAQHAQYSDLHFWKKHAVMLEEAGFDTMFFADVSGLYDVYEGTGTTAIRAGMQYPALDPLLLISALAAETSTIGFGVTANVSYLPPYLLARTFATLDHLTNGRIGWNIVTGYQRSALRNLGGEDMLPHDQRYDRADEYMEVVYGLWEASVEPDAIVGDVTSNTYIDPKKVHPIDHSGDWFTVPGPALVTPGPQRTPLLFQAGSSPRGIEFAVKHAEALFFSGTSPENVRQLVDRVEQQMQAAGRSRASARLITSVTVIAAATDEAAYDRFRDYSQYVDQDAALALFAGWTGLDLSQFKPTDVLQDVHIEGNRSALQSFTSMDPDRQWTIADLASYMSIGARGPVIVGSGKTVVDELERWVREAGVDGFNIDYALRGPDMAAFAQFVTPELRARGHLGAALQDEAHSQTLRGRIFGTDWLPQDSTGGAYRGSKRSL
ncbi:NtaA/DmoA family FMN-dependent monooxygenase [Enteractinococcus coprophilus]|uniref:FMN-dependent oxidoreductase (Nitrilotriacetate monooxygenase family) n=1 Tax=Enteractinococcus coprophilus TaxID=1027633 RepID=A0A543AP04_9MICC|nr:NtaA/DmoA family FMN-dependent monooxygenase [Enteractinococcus coprophilus]TQL74307.1 FMN-dependent oxidoreductase (nitrilotriacetate monooxygenase family) [Enteractinococcus coprophilus]